MRGEISLYVPIIAILDIWKTTLFYVGESAVYDGFKYVWPVKGYEIKKYKKKIKKNCRKMSSDILVFTHMWGGSS